MEITMRFIPLFLAAVLSANQTIIPHNNDPKHKRDTALTEGIHAVGNRLGYNGSFYESRTGVFTNQPRGERDTLELSVMRHFHAPDQPEFPSSPKGDAKHSAPVISYEQTLVDMDSVGAHKAIHAFVDTGKVPSAPIKGTEMHMANE
jgi:hypothetical protein